MVSATALLALLANSNAKASAIANAAVVYHGPRLSPLHGIGLLAPLPLLAWLLALLTGLSTS